MNMNEYQTLAGRTINKDLSMSALLDHAVLGLNSEAGECAGILQKMYQGHHFDKDEMMKELGDALWFIAEAATALDVELNDIAEKNINKLLKRYPEGFTVEDSVNRQEYRAKPQIVNIKHVEVFNEK